MPGFWCAQGDGAGPCGEHRCPWSSPRCPCKLPFSWALAQSYHTDPWGVRWAQGKGALCLPVPVTSHLHSIPCLCPFLFVSGVCFLSPVHFVSCFLSPVSCFRSRVLSVSASSSPRFLSALTPVSPLSPSPSACAWAVVLHRVGPAWTRAWCSWQLQWGGGRLGCLSSPLGPRGEAGSPGCMRAKQCRCPVRQGPPG